jgi:hypothetical protein
LSHLLSPRKSTLPSISGGVIGHGFGFMVKIIVEFDTVLHPIPTIRCYFIVNISVSRHFHSQPINCIVSALLF